MKGKSWGAAKATSQWGWELGQRGARVCEETSREMGTWNKIKSNPPSGFRAHPPAPSPALLLLLFLHLSLQLPSVSLFVSQSLPHSVSHFPFMILFFSPFLSL